MKKITVKCMIMSDTFEELCLFELNLWWFVRRLLPVSSDCCRNEGATHGAYGYLPKVGTSYGKYDFTDVEKVQQNRAIREEYLEQSNKIQEEIDRMIQQGAPIDEIADRVVSMRNQDKISARAKMAPEELAPIEERNMKIYGNPIGPDAKWLFNSKKLKMLEEHLNPTDEEIWQSIINSSMKKDDVLNTLLGLKH